MSDNRLKKQAAKGKRTIKAYQRLFATDDGKIVLQDLMQSCHMLSQNFGSDPNEAMYSEGERAVVLRILRTLNTDAEMLMKHLDAVHQEE